jgi:uncharacterized protein (TIGR02099 family)
LTRSTDDKHAIDKPTLIARVRQWLAAVTAVLIIATAVVVGIGRLLIPYADELRPWLEDRLSERLGQPVSIERVSARWPRLTPQIILDGLRAGDDETPLLAVDEARLELHLQDVLRSGRNPFRLVVLGLDLVLAQDASGRWGLRLAGGGEFDWSEGAGQGLAGDVVVRDVEVRVSPRRGPQLDLIISEGEIRRRGTATGLVARAHPAAAPDAALRLAVRAEHADGELASATGRITLDRLRLEAPGLDRVLPDYLELPPDRLDARAEFDWQPGGGALDLDLALDGDAGFEAGASLRVERDGARLDAELIELRRGETVLARNVIISRRAPFWAAEIPTLELGDLHALGARWLGRGPRWPEVLAGEVADLSVLVDDSGSFHRLSGRVDDLGIDLPEDKLELSGLDFGLSLAGDRAALSLAGSPSVHWPEKMRQAVAIDSIRGRLLVSPRAVEVDGVIGERTEARGRAEGWVWLGGARPFLDLTVIAERIDAIDPRPWLPAGQIPPEPLAWLDRALLSIDGAQGGINYHFRLGRKLPEWESGDFQAWVDFTGLQLDFWEGWPMGRDLDGRVDFIGRGMTGRIDRGRLGAVTLEADRIAIPDLTEPALSIDLEAEEADAGSVHAVLGALPFETFSRFVDPLSAAGPVNLDIGLYLPFRRMSDWELGGDVVLRGTTLGLTDTPLQFPDLSGRVAFDREGIEPSALVIGGDSAPAVTLAADFESPARLTVDGSLAPGSLLRDRPPWSSLAARLGGSSRWRAALSGHPSGGWQLELSSDLRGLSLDFPSPLNKPAEQALPLSFSLRGHDEALTLSAGLGETLGLVAENGAGRWRVAAGLGRAAPALPSRAGFEIAGSLEQLDIQAWTDVLDTGTVQAGGEGGEQGRVRLDVERLDYGNLSLRDVALDARREAAQWQMELGGPSAEGEVTIPRPIDSGRVVAVDLARLDLSHSLGPEPAADLANAPVPAQTRTHVPTEFPPLHLLVESLHVGDLALGRVRMESHARRDGIEIERVEVAGPMLTLSGYGRWILSDSGPVTEFEGRLISTDLPELLAAMGQATQFEAARTQVDIEGHWPGAPFDFSLARLDGTMALLMTDGSIPEASPGAGRLLGLASLSAMPRRLMLDFRDVFGEGLKFDRIEGGFELSGGVARTDGLRLESPAADITMSGATDLGARRYDQTIVVEPGVGGTLPVIGGLAGGPAGAAAGLVLRSLLERPLQGLAEVRYRVTGPWSDPEVALIDARAAETASEIDPAAGPEPDSEPPTEGEPPPDNTPTSTPR